MRRILQGLCIVLFLVTSQAAERRMPPPGIDVLKKLPLKWDRKRLRLQNNTVSTRTHLPVLIFPNPLNPDRYVVLNSGFTFSEFGHLSNSLQTPQLPDWALVDTRVSRSNRLKKGIHSAGFYDENWE